MAIDAFNAREANTLCSRAAGDDAVEVGEYKPDYSNFYFTRPGERVWKMCTGMYAAGWATCPDFTIAPADAELDAESIPSGALIFTWGSDSPYRAASIILEVPDGAPDPQWVWGGQDFYCEG